MLYFIERRINSDFSGLNVTSHFSAQRWILARSKFNCSAVCMGSSSMIYKLVSSAKSLIEELMSTTMSLIYKRNRRGPIIESCGTPAFKSKKNLHQAEQPFVFCQLDNKRTKSATIQKHLQI